MRDKVLFADDFKGFRIGEFPYDRDHSAAGEYHYVVEEGPHGAWTDQVCNYRYNGHGPSWIITEDHGKHFMEQCRIEKGLPHRIFPTLQTGTVLWRDYDVEVTMRRISTKGMAGLAFCMNNSLDTLVFSLEGRERARLAWRHKEEVKVLAEAAVLSGPDSYYRLKVSVDGEQIQCFVDGVQVFSVRDARAAKGGKIGLTADCPTQFADVRVSVDRGTEHAIREQEERERKARELGEAGEKEVNYKLKWWLAEHSAYRSIAADCVSKYSGGCIRIAAWDYMKEPQEIDHLLVGPAGVIHIETKNYVGTIRVDDTNYWDRDMRNAGHFTTTESPAFQVKRHAALLSKIVGEDVPVCGIICLANPNVKLQDADNSEIPVVKLGELPELLDALDKSTASPLTAQKVTEVIGKIEKAKVRGFPQSQCNPTAKAGGLWCEPRA